MLLLCDVVLHFQSEDEILSLSMTFFGLTFLSHGSFHNFFVGFKGEMFMPVCIFFLHGKILEHKDLIHKCQPINYSFVCMLLISLTCAQFKPIFTLT